MFEPPKNWTRQKQQKHRPEESSHESSKADHGQYDRCPLTSRLRLGIGHRPLPGIRLRS